MFNVSFSNNSARFLKKCDKILYKRIMDKIKELRYNPFPAESKKVEGEKGKVYRVRVGGYRILYAVFYEDNDLFISKLDKRPRVYK